MNWDDSTDTNKKDGDFRLNYSDAFLSIGVTFANEQYLGLMLDFGHLVSPILQNVETIYAALSDEKRRD